MFGCFLELVLFISQAGTALDKHIFFFQVLKKPVRGCILFLHVLIFCCFVLIGDSRLPSLLPRGGSLLFTNEDLG